MFAFLRRSNKAEKKWAISCSLTSSAVSVSSSLLASASF